MCVSGSDNSSFIAIIVKIISGKGKLKKKNNEEIFNAIKCKENCKCKRQWFIHYHDCITHK
jgi:hypothetical protein